MSSTARLVLTAVYQCIITTDILSGVLNELSLTRSLMVTLDAHSTSWNLMSCVVGKQPSSQRWLCVAPNRPWYSRAESDMAHMFETLVIGPIDLLSMYAQLARSRVRSPPIIRHTLQQRSGSQQSQPGFCCGLYCARHLL